MRRVIASTFATVDGRIDDLAGWALPYDDDAAARYHDDLLATSDALLLGRKTYEVFAAIWPPRSGELPYVDRLNSLPKFVASRRTGRLRWNNSHLIDGDAAEGVAELKRRDGQNLVLYGGRDLMQSLQDRDLIDEYRILVHPVLLGKGRGLLGDRAQRLDLDLVDVSVMPHGVAVLTYQPRR